MRDTDLAQADLAELLTILGMGDQARPQSPHEVFQEALGVLRQRLAELDRWRGLTEAVGKIIGAAEGWPTHGNAPLAIAATVQLLQTEVTRNIQPKPLSEWTEEDGDVLWWRFPIEEPPYCGSPQDLGHSVELHTHDSTAGPRIAARCSIGGWPGGYTHWTRIPEICEP